MGESFHVLIILKALAALEEENRKMKIEIEELRSEIAARNEELRTFRDEMKVKVYKVY